jgi:hypothetical protein
MRAAKGWPQGDATRRWGQARWPDDRAAVEALFREYVPLQRGGALGVRRNLTIISVAALGTVVFWGAVLVGLGALFDGGPAPVEWIGSVTVSPDKRHKAVLFKTAQSGIASYCHDQIFVVPEAVADDAARRERGSDVYSAECDDYASTPKSPIIQWLGNDTLQITYSKGTGVTSKPSNAAKTVKVHVVAQKQ